MVAHLSTVSLTSSSSSGSEPQIVKTTTQASEANPQLAANRVSSCSSSIDVTDSAVSGCSKPSNSMGAIPKSISFDMTAERGDKEMLDDDQKGKRGFFGKLKMSLRNRRGKSLRHPDYERGLSDSGNDVGSGDGRHRLRRIMSEDVTSTCSANSGKCSLLM